VVERLSGVLAPAHLPAQDAADEVLEQIRQATESAIGHLTLADLAAAARGRR
jgi:hypothetical protein